MPDTLHELEATLRSRHRERPDGSYSVTLFDDRELVQRKVMEEAFEVVLELGRPTTDAGRVAEEAADLLYHLVAGLVSVGVAVDDVLAVLDRRRR